MTSHWSKYKKCVLKFHDDYKSDPDLAFPQLKIFLSDNEKIFVDYRLWMDYAVQQTHIHVNFYLKCKDWNKLRMYYQPPLHKDMRFFLFIDDLHDIKDTTDWISYCSMRQHCNFEPWMRNYKLSFDTSISIKDAEPLPKEESGDRIECDNS